MNWQSSLYRASPNTSTTSATMHQLFPVHILLPLISLQDNSHFSTQLDEVGWPLELHLPLEWIKIRISQESIEILTNYDRTGAPQIATTLSATESLRLFDWATCAWVKWIFLYKNTVPFSQFCQSPMGVAGDNFCTLNYLMYIIPPVGLATLLRPSLDCIWNQPICSSFSP